MEVENDFTGFECFVSNTQLSKRSSTGTIAHAVTTFVTFVLLTSIYGVVSDILMLADVIPSIGVVFHLVVLVMVALFVSLFK